MNDFELGNTSGSSQLLKLMMFCLVSFGWHETGFVLPSI